MKHRGGNFSVLQPKLKFQIMKNKVLALSAAVLLSAGIAFSFANGTTCCDQSKACTANASATEACCDLPCPIENCPLGCGK